MGTQKDFFEICRKCEHAPSTHIFHNKEKLVGQKKLKKIRNWIGLNSLCRGKLFACHSGHALACRPTDWTSLAHDLHISTSVCQQIPGSHVILLWDNNTINPSMVTKNMETTTLYQWNHQPEQSLWSAILYHYTSSTQMMTDKSEGCVLDLEAAVLLYNIQKILTTMSVSQYNFNKC